MYINVLADRHVRDAFDTTQQGGFPLFDVIESARSCSQQWQVCGTNMSCPVADAGKVLLYA